MIKKLLLLIIMCILLTSVINVNGVKDNSIQLKWKTSAYELGITLNTEPVLQDINGDGIQEIFVAGKIYPNYETNPDAPWIHLLCIDGNNGGVIWRANYSTNYVSSNNDHWCPMVYDFDKDGEYEVTVSSGWYGQTMYNAETGEVEWYKEDISSGWHNIGFIDKGEVVYLYLIESWSGGPSAGGLQKVYASNGTLVNRVPHSYECWGGVSIADIDDDGEYEILVTDRAGTSYGYKRGISCYDENLNYEWHDDRNTYSTQCPIIADIDDDGNLEVIVGSQGGNNRGHVRIYSGDGNVEHTSPMYIGFHHQPAIGDVDGDGNLELVSTKNKNEPKIYDLKLHILDENSLGTPATLGPDIMDVLIDDNDLPEILHTGDTGAGNSASLFRYINGNYEVVHTFDHRIYWGVASDVDGDGFKEIVMGRVGSWDKVNSNFLWCYETEMPIAYPAALTNVAFGGLQRQNNDLYVKPAGYEKPVDPPLDDDMALIILITAIILALTNYLSYLQGKKKR